MDHGNLDPQKVFLIGAISVVILAIVASGVFPEVTDTLVGQAGESTFSRDDGSGSSGDSTEVLDDLLQGMREGASLLPLQTIVPAGCSPVEESCNGLDDNCDGLIDGTITETHRIFVCYYQDRCLFHDHECREGSRCVPQIFEHFDNEDRTGIVPLCQQNALEERGTLGDINNNGVIDGVDRGILTDYILGRTRFQFRTTFDRANVDYCRGSQGLDLYDLILLQHHISGFNELQCP